MEQVTLQASSAPGDTATLATDQFGNPLKMKGHRGVKVIVDMTAVPGVKTVTPKIEYKDAVSGKWITALTGPAIVATGTHVLTVYPGLTETANIDASDLIPDLWRVVCTYSGADAGFTFSVGAYLLH